MVERFNILSLSGGGFLGLYTVSVLAGLEEVVGGPIARHFDLLAGTSVGGIIALGLAAEIPAHTIKEAFEQNGTAIFSGRPAPSS
jgi:patatin-like phospholipase/acyl hydrolase